jgi:hypothetical protein
LIFTVFSPPCSGDAKPTRVVRNAPSFRLEDLDSGLGKTVDVNDNGTYVDCFTQVCYYNSIMWSCEAHSGQSICLLYIGAISDDPLTAPPGRTVYKYRCKVI